ncbi:MAG: CPBP family intramembrane metalloprotease [Candidatus Heimdallarchaeota archaeon]|nr:CPBP family intramembrane metalloprotease [Candidatus Heimdallarchaeota archaeon]
MEKSSLSITKFYATVFCWSWIIWVPMVLHHYGVINFPLPIVVGQTLGAIAPIAVLLRMHKPNDEKMSLKSLLWISRPKGIWIALAIFLLPCLVIMVNILQLLLNQTPSTGFILNSTIVADLGIFIIIIIPIQFITSTFTSPLFEEPGWRWFALPRLQEKLGKTIGSCIVGGLWWIWHIPIYLYSDIGIQLQGFLAMICYSFIADSLFNLSGKHIWIAMLFHQSISATS